jgi:hypothetical protein
MIQKIKNAGAETNNETKHITTVASGISVDVLAKTDSYVTYSKLFISDASIQMVNVLNVIFK